MKDPRLATALSCLAVLLLGCPLMAHAYKEVTHQQMAKAAANASVLSQASTLSNLGLLYAITDPSQKFPNCVVPVGNVQSGNRMIIELIQDGLPIGRGQPVSVSVPTAASTRVSDANNRLTTRNGVVNQISFICFIKGPDGIWRLESM